MRRSGKCSLMFSSAYTNLKSAADSLPASPERKRQRLSSPYDGSTDPLTQDEVIALDALESKLLQTSPINTNSKGKATLDKAARDELFDDDENPFISTPALPGFASAALLRKKSASDHVSIAERPLHEPDYGAEFRPASETSFVGFQAASAAAGPSVRNPTSTLGFASAGIGFSSAGKKSIYAPSKTALAAAQAKMEAIWNEDEDNTASPTSPVNQTSMDVFARSANVVRPTFRALENAFNSPKTPLPMDRVRNRGKINSNPVSPSMDRSRGKGKEVENFEGEPSNAGSTIHTPLSIAKPRNSKQFVSPLMTRRPRLSEGEQSSASCRTELHTAFSSATSQLPASQRRFTTPCIPGLAAATPTKTQCTGPRTGTFKPPSRSFATPFKAGAVPRSNGKAPMHKVPNSAVTPSKFPCTQSLELKGRPCFFNLSMSPNPIGTQLCSSAFSTAAKSNNPKVIRIVASKLR